MVPRRTLVSRHGELLVAAAVSVMFAAGAQQPVEAVTVRVAKFSGARVDQVDLAALEMVSRSAALCVDSRGPRG